ncbi:DNA repair protein RadC [Candidatus Roizmanbacteria bacterium]|nr:DNA repair protein RadC [Candidatus Roizmanbacteria bacterium]
MKIKDLPLIDRPREKLLRYGAEKLTSEELLAILLGSGAKGISALELSTKVLKQFGEKKLQTSTTSDFQNLLGIGKTKACRIIAAFELGKRLLTGKKTSFVMKPKDVWNEFMEIRGSQKEHFVVFYLNVRNQIIQKEIISIGILNTSLVHPREVFEPAVKHLAAQILISHNHPSGDCTPSDEDMELTKRLIDAGKILGIEIIDHVIVSAQQWYSLKEHLLL